MFEAHEGRLSVRLSAEKKKPLPSWQVTKTVKGCCANNMDIIPETERKTTRGTNVYDDIHGMTEG